MFTSDNRYLRTSFIYMTISVILMIAGAVYEHFSFGVYSYFMIYAFAIPLVGGALPFLAKYMRKQRRDSADPYASEQTGTSHTAAQHGTTTGAAHAAVQQVSAPGAPTSTSQESGSIETGRAGGIEAFYHLALATLTAGSIVHGILAICGRPNSLTVIYLVAGLLLLAVTALGAVKSSAQRS